MLLHDHIDPRLPTIWGAVGDRAWAEPGFKIHYFPYPPAHDMHTFQKPISHSYTFITIPFAYLDPQRALEGFIAAHLVSDKFGTSNVYVRPLLKGEEEKQDDKDERALNNFDAVIQQWVSEMTTL